MDLENFVGHNVNVVTSDGKELKNYYASFFSDASDNVEPDEDCIGLKKSSDESDGIILYQSEIKGIKIVD